MLLLESGGGLIGGATLRWRSCQAPHASVRDRSTRSTQKKGTREAPKKHNEGTGSNFRTAIWLLTISSDSGARGLEELLFSTAKWSVEAQSLRRKPRPGFLCLQGESRLGKLEIQLLRGGYITCYRFKCVKELTLIRNESSLKLYTESQLLKSHSHSNHTLHETDLKRPGGDLDR